MEKKSLKRLTALGLASLLLSGAVLSQTVYAEENLSNSGTINISNDKEIDITPPVFISISTDKTEVSVGETVTYTVKASDNKNLDSVYVYLKNKKSDRGTYVYSNELNENGDFVMKLPIEEDMAGGEWVVSLIAISDKSSNMTRVFEGDASLGDSGAINISNDKEIDVTPPVFISISTDKTEVSVGDTVTYTVKASDNKNLDSVYVYLKNKKSDRGTYVYSNELNENGDFVMKLPIEEDMAGGEWVVSLIAISDKSSNITRIFEGDLSVNNNIGVIIKDVPEVDKDKNPTPPSNDDKKDPSTNQPIITSKGESTVQEELPEFPVGLVPAFNGKQQHSTNQNSGNSNLGQGSQGLQNTEKQGNKSSKNSMTSKTSNLPKTGETASTLAFLSGLVMLGFAFLGLKSKKN